MSKIYPSYLISFALRIKMLKIIQLHSKRDPTCATKINSCIKSRLLGNNPSIMFINVKCYYIYFCGNGNKNSMRACCCCFSPSTLLVLFTNNYTSVVSCILLLLGKRMPVIKLYCMRNENRVNETFTLCKHENIKI